MTDLAPRSARRWLALVFVVITVVRLPWLTYPFFNMDEAVASAIGNRLLDGGVMYREAVDTRGPLSYYAYAAMFALWGRDNMTAVHGVLLVLVLGLCWAVYRLGRMIQGRWVGCWAATLFGFFTCTAQPTEFFAFNVEWLVMVCTTLGALTLLAGLKRGRTLWHAAAGAAFALAALAKQPAWMDAAAALVFLACATVVRGGSPVGALGACASFLAGLLGLFGAVVAWFWRVGALSEFWFYYWSYPINYYVGVASWMKRLAIGMPLLHEYYQAHAVLLILFLAGALALRRPQRGRWSALATWYPLGWGVASYFGATSSGRGFIHYMLQSLPPFCLMGAYAVEALRRGTQRLIPTGLPRRVMAMRACVIATVAAGLYVPLTTHASTMMLLIRGKLGLGPEVYAPNGAIRDTADYIRAHSDADDTIFVWGWLAEIYGLSGRRSASRYVFCSFLSGMIAWENTGPDVDTSATIVPGSWDVLKRELQQARPRYIVDTSPGNYRFYGKYPPDRLPLLQKVLSQEYWLEKTFASQDGAPAIRLFRRLDAARVPVEGAGGWPSR